MLLALVVVVGIVVSGISTGAAATVAVADDNGDVGTVF